MFNFGRLKVRTYSPPTILTEMILIDKLSFTKYYSVIIWLIIIVPCSIIFQGCEKEDYYSTDKDEIINSIEFEEFIAANMELFSVLEQAKSMIKNPEIKNTMKTVELEQGAIVRTLQFKTEQNLLKDVLTKGEVFLKKYPSYRTYRMEVKKELVLEAINVSMPINKLMFQEGLSVRLKSGNIESGSSGHDYSGFWNAFNYVLDYMDANGVEIGGYIFQGGGALIYPSPNATSTTWQAPGPVFLVEDSNGAYVSIYNNQAIQATFHTHPNSSIPSPTDIYSMMTCFPNCDLIILYNCNAYVYTFEYGHYIP